MSRIEELRNDPVGCIKRIALVGGLGVGSVLVGRECLNRDSREAQDPIYINGTPNTVEPVIPEIQATEISPQSTPQNQPSSDNCRTVEIGDTVSEILRDFQPYGSIRGIPVEVRDTEGVPRISGTIANNQKLDEIDPGEEVCVVGESTPEQRDFMDKDSEELIEICVTGEEFNSVDESLISRFGGNGDLEVTVTIPESASITGVKTRTDELGILAEENFPLEPGSTVCGEVSEPAGRGGGSPLHSSDTVRSRSKQAVVYSAEVPSRTGFARR